MPSLGISPLFETEYNSNEFIKLQKDEQIHLNLPHPPKKNQEICIENVKKGFDYFKEEYKIARKLINEIINMQGNNSKQMIYTTKELLDKLRKEHKETFYYRGQTKKYETPLWPSMYRGL